MAQATFPKLSATKIDLGQKLTITLQAESADYTHKLTATIGTSSTVLKTDAQGSYQWTVPLSYQSNSLYAKSTSALITIKCETFNGSTKIGEKSVVFYGVLPNSIVPVISNVKVSNALDPFEFVQYYTALVYEVTASTPNATGVTYTYKYGEVMSDSNVYSDNNIIETSGEYRTTITVTDSRGRSTSTAIKMNIRAYGKPSVELTSYDRTFDIITLNISGFKYNDDHFTDPGLLRVNYKKHSDQSYTALSNESVQGEFEKTLAINDVDSNSAYDIVISLEDAYYSEPIIQRTTIPTNHTIIDFNASGKGIAFGKESEADDFDVNMDAVFRKEVMVKGEKLVEQNDIAINMIPFPYSQGNRIVAGLTITIEDDGTIDIDGTSTASTNIILFDNRTTTESMLIRYNVPYTLSWDVYNADLSGVYMAVRHYDASKTNIGTAVLRLNNTDKMINLTRLEGSEYMSIFVTISSDITLNHLRVKPQLEVGEIVHDYRKYAGPGEKLMEVLFNLHQHFH